MNAYEIIETVCGGFKPWVTDGKPSVVGTLPSGDRIEVIKSYPMTVIVNGKREHAIARLLRIVKPEDKIAINDVLKSAVYFGGDVCMHPSTLIDYPVHVDKERKTVYTRMLNRRMTLYKGEHFAHWFLARKVIQTGEYPPNLKLTEEDKEILKYLTKS